MSRRRTAWILGAVVALAATAFLVPAAADWLVTGEGDRIETDGPWKVEGRLVVFKRSDGTYASMRRSEVDLEASERITREMAEEARRPRDERASEENPDRRESVARLTEKDLPPVGRSPDREEAEEGASAGDGEESSPPGELAIASWREVSEVDGAGIEFTGQIRNPTEHMAIGVGVTVTLFDEQDEEVGSTDAVLTGTSLPPGKSGAFRASFPGVFDYARAEFDISGNLVQTGSEAQADGPDEG